MPLLRPPVFQMTTLPSRPDVLILLTSGVCCPSYALTLVMVFWWAVFLSPPLMLPVPRAPPPPAETLLTPCLSASLNLLKASLFSRPTPPTEPLEAVAAFDLDEGSSSDLLTVQPELASPVKRMGS